MKIHHLITFFFLFITLTVTKVFGQPDLPNPPSNFQTVPVGSYVIPMDTINQALNPPFNLKAYGLAHSLLLNDIPVKWVIRAGKVKDAIDFSAIVERVYPSFQTAAMKDFSCSAFIIDTTYLNKPFYSFGKTAIEVINDFGNNVAIFRLTQDETVDVRYELNQRPKIAVFSNGGNQKIHQAILDSAGVTNYYIINAGAFPGISKCYTFCSEPHWNGGPADTSITNIIKNYVLEGGNFLAQCKGVDTYENLSFFHTDNGVQIINENVNNLYFNNDLAYMQFQGPMKENQGGSERNWIRAMSSTWVTGFYHCISGTYTDTVVAAAAHIIHPDSVGGNVYMLGGHDYAPYDDMKQINAARLYLNASLVPSGRPTPYHLDAGLSQAICLGDTVIIGGSPTGPNNATFWWSPASSLDDSTLANPTAFPTTTTTYVVMGEINECPALPDTITITVDSASFVDAGTDQTVCSNNPDVSLNGSVSGGSTTGQWTTSGSGTFLPNDSALTVTYVPSPADTAAGFVTLYLYSTHNGGCSAAVDSVFVIITPSPDVDAGPDDTVCANNADVLLNATVSGGSTTGIWSSNGTGVFTPNDSDLSATYVPSPADTVAGTVTLMLVSTNNGSCFPDTDWVVVTITPKPLVDAGPDDTVCANNADVPLNGSIIGGTSTGIWSSSGTGVFTPNDSDLTATYVPSPADTVAGTVILTLISTNNGGCLPDTDQVVITITPKPYVEAGPNDTVCSNNPLVSLSGLVAYGSTSGQWSSSGTGTFIPGPNDLNADYLPSAADTAAGMITLVLTSTNNGNCLPVSDTMNIIINPEPVIDAGNDTTVCANIANFNINGTGWNTSNVQWTTSGTGSFADSSSLHTSYYPSQADTASGSVYLILTVYGMPPCDSVTDSILVDILPEAIVNAGLDTSLCEDEEFVLMAGTYWNAAGAYWTSSGGGSFVPDSSALNATYYFGNPGIDTLVLHSIGSCNDMSDTIYISVNPLPNSAFGNSEGCLGQVTLFTDSTLSTNPIINWQWYFGDGGQSSEQSPSHLYGSTGTYAVTLIVETDKGCFDTITKIVSVNLTPDADFFPDPVIVNLHQPINFTDLSHDAISWFYDFGDSLGTSDQQHPTYTYHNAGGVYVVMQVVTNEWGCTDTIYKEVIVTMPPLVPTGFSPNNDGHNDILYVLGGPFRDINFQIFNNWGELIFVSQRQSDGWDGTRNGVKQPMGVYVYTLRAVTEDGMEHRLHGDVTLLR